MTPSEFSWQACVPFWAFVTANGGALVVFVALFWWAWFDGLSKGRQHGWEQHERSMQEAPTGENPTVFVDRDATAAHDRPSVASGTSADVWHSARHAEHNDSPSNTR